MTESKYFKHIKLSDGREIIVFTGQPAFVAMVLDEVDPMPSVGTQTKDGTIIGVMHWFDTLSPDEETPARIAALMRRVGEWYYYAVKTKTHKS